MMENGGSDGEGHRARLRNRLLEHGPDALEDHEIVEYLLALTLPRRDTKPMAKALLRRFGSFGALLAADISILRRETALRDTQIAALKVVQAAAIRLLGKPLREQPVLSSSRALHDYLRADMAHMPIERVRILFLDSRNRLIEEQSSDGSIDESAVYVREVLKRAMNVGATALILVHNHPSGDPTPSQQDIRLTRTLAEAARPLRIVVHDHLVVGASGQASLRELGLYDP